jgi:hypothetical protein
VGGGKGKSGRDEARGSGNGNRREQGGEGGSDGQKWRSLGGEGMESQIKVWDKQPSQPSRKSNGTTGATAPPVVKQGRLVSPRMDGYKVSASSTPRNTPALNPHQKALKKMLDKKYNMDHDTSLITVVEAPSSDGRKRRKMRDANAPKHPKSSFLFFNSKENRQKLKDENPNISFSKPVVPRL